MLATTIEIIRSALKADPTLTPADRTRITALLREGPKTPSPETSPASRPHIIGRAKTAERLDKSLRFIDRLAQQGILKKVILPGRKRAVGFLEADVEALIRG